MHKTITTLLILATFLLGACARMETPAQPTSLLLAQPSPMGVRTEQEKRSFEIFEQILAAVQESADDRNFPRVEQLYLELIITCPDVGLAQESAWRLFTKYYERNTPESLVKARELYDYFVRLYPQSVFRNMMTRRIEGPAADAGKK